MKKLNGRSERRKESGAASTVGLPPGSLVHIGKRRAEQVTVSGIFYDSDDYRSSGNNELDELLPLKSEEISWLNIDGLHDVQLLEHVADTFDIHSLIMEDILNTEQRPKLEITGDKVFVVLKMISMTEDGRLDFEQVSLILGRNYVITFQERKGDVFDPVRQRIEHGFGRVRKMGPDYLAYALMDVIIDQYYATLELLGERIERLEEQFPDAVESEVFREIHDIRQKILVIRKAVWPLRDVVNTLGREEASLVDPSVRPYVRDLYDHTITIIDNVETYRDMASGIMDTYLSSVSIRMNEVMKVLTIIATIFIPLTFITGLYGMNFEYMPELTVRWGYPAVWTVMILSVLGMLWFFKRKKWF